VAVEYELVHVAPTGRERAHRYTAESELGAGDLVRYEGRDWLVDHVDQPHDGLKRALVKPARYRLRLRHPDGREEVGAFRRYRADAPRAGHTFSTLENGSSVSWLVVDERFEHDQQGEPYLDLVAERDYSEAEEPPELPEHELEHVLPRVDERNEAVAAVARAEAAGLSVELVALEPGEAPDWAEAEAYIDALVLEEIEDDLLELCGVDPDRDRRETWLDRVKARLRSDLERFRDDIEGDQDEIEEWDFRDGRVFASFGRYEDESDPDTGHGWLSRLVDVSALAAAGFSRVRKAELQV
jgi:hypothetical protein